MRRSKLLAGDLLYSHSPDLDVAHGGIAVAESFVHILLHDDVERFPLAFVLLLVNHFALGDDTFRLHAVAASHLRMLEDQAVIHAHGDAHPWIAA